MTLSDAFSPAQCLGYVSFVLGVSAFLQRDDRRLRLLNATQCIFYMLHFALLGRPSASVSSLVSGTRTFLSLKTRSPWVALVMFVLGATLGVHLARDTYGYLPVLATAISTPAIFFLRGIRLRLALLICTCLWLINNVHSNSYGGTVLECFVATANSITIARLAQAQRAEGLNAAEETREPDELEAEPEREAAVG
jgi:multisubunit Na+/H+ antiporter MnhG subunit